MNSNFELNTPVAYVIFNRPDCVRKSFESIRKARPKKLFIIADGPRADHPDDRRLCDECRSIVENVDWNCEVHRNYSDVNLGCGIRPSSGFSWVFSQVEEAIILEDDCVASISFYRFCQEMLERYRNDERVLTISGMGFGYRSSNGADCYFSRFNNTWGWATWKRVWDMYDYHMKDYPAFKKSGALQKILLRKDYVDYWYRVFDPLYERGDNSVWDGQFMFMSFLHKGLHLYPAMNMVQYTGWGETSTHCQGAPAEGSPMSLITQSPEEMPFPVSPATDMHDDFLVDCRMMEGIYGIPIDGVKTKPLIEVTDAELNAMRSAENLIIYGAGKVSQELICRLGKAGIHRFHVAVTKDAVSKYIMGNKVVEISTLVSEKEKSLVVIAVKSKQATEDIKNELFRLGFPWYFALGEVGGAAKGMFLAESAIDTRLREKKKHGEKIHVVFVCHRPQVWPSLKTVCEAFRQDPLFRVTVVAIPTKKCFPDTGFSLNEYEGTGAEAFWSGKGCVNGYDYGSGEWLDLKSVAPDYVFFQQPYNVMRPDQYSSLLVSRYAKICYVAYGYEMMRGDVIEGSHPDDFFQNVTYYFSQDKYNQDFMADYLERKDNRFTRSILTGYPKFDTVETIRKPCDTGTLKAVWCPRWCEDEGNSNFYEYGHGLADFFADSDNAELLFRPHPQMRINMRADDARKEQRLAEMMAHIAGSRHCRIDDGENYADSFEWSDCMIADMTSLMGDYFLTGKPIIYCHKVDCFSEAGRHLAEGFYWVRNLDELKQTLAMLANGDDPLFEKRQAIIREHYFLPEGGAGRVIKEYIKADALKQAVRKES